jgi:hypothetical protein
VRRDDSSDGLLPISEQLERPVRDLPVIGIDASILAFGVPDWRVLYSALNVLLELG